MLRFLFLILGFQAVLLLKACFCGSNKVAGPVSPACNNQVLGIIQATVCSLGVNPLPGISVLSNSVICEGGRGLSSLSLESSSERLESSESLSKLERDGPGESLKNQSRYSWPDFGMVELSIRDAILVVLAGETQQLAFYKDWREWHQPRTHD